MTHRQWNGTSNLLMLATIPTCVALWFDMAPIELLAALWVVAHWAQGRAYRALLTEMTHA